MICTIWSCRRKQKKWNVNFFSTNSYFHDKPSLPLKMFTFKKIADFFDIFISFFLTNSKFHDELVKTWTPQTKGVSWPSGWTVGKGPEQNRSTALNQGYLNIEWETVEKIISMKSQHWANENRLKLSGAIWHFSGVQKKSLWWPPQKWTYQHRPAVD